MAAELGQHTVELSTLLTRAAHDSHTYLKELIDKCSSAHLSDTDKRITILKFLNKTRQRMIRLHVISKWCQQIHCFSCMKDFSKLVLLFMIAIEVLLTGNYLRLPKCIEEVVTQNILTEDQQKPALKKLDTLVRSKLLEASLPKEISEIKVSDGTVLLRVDGEFKVLVTLGYRGHLSMWRI